MKVPSLASQLKLRLQLTIGAVLIVCTAYSQPFLQQLERANPPQRVRWLLLYFDTCQAVIKQEAFAFRVLDQVDAIGKRQRDEKLIHYGRMLRDTYAKNSDSLTIPQKAALFLAVGKRADDPQIAAVCQHFAGLYYSLTDDYGRTFENLLSANKQFRDIGLQNIPEIHRYLYELALNYYQLKEPYKTIALLREASHYPPFSPNLHIQTYNTLGLAHTWLSPQKHPNKSKLAEVWYLKARTVAQSYSDTLWMDIINANLADLYREQGRWRDALNGYLADYRSGLRISDHRYLPFGTAKEIAEIYLELGQSDSCRYFMGQAAALYARQQQRTKSYGSLFEDDFFLKDYANLARMYFAKTGNSPLAYTFADSMIRVTKRITNRYDKGKLITANRNLLIKQHQLELEAIEARNHAWQLGVALALVTLVLFLGLLAFRFRANRQHQRRELILNGEREKILRLEKKLLEEELQRAKAELLNFVNSLQVNKTQSLLGSSLLTNEDWIEFRNRFEQLYPDFFRQLRAHLGEVSPAEERLLALSKLRLHIRQMSHMLGISPDSIRKARYRLRKKFGMSGDASLLALLEDEAESVNE